MLLDGDLVRLLVVDKAAEWPQTIVLYSSELPWNDEGMWALLRELAEDRDGLEAHVIATGDINAVPVAVAWPNGEWLRLEVSA